MCVFNSRLNSQRLSHGKISYLSILHAFNSHSVAAAAAATTNINDDDKQKEGNGKGRAAYM